MSIDRRHVVGHLVLPLVLAALTGLLMVAAPFLASADDHVPQGRIWAADGDSVGESSSLTLSFGLLDARGSATKLAENTGLVRDQRGTVLLSYFSPWSGNVRTILRGWGTTDDDRSGRLGFWTGDAGGFWLRGDLSRYLTYDDPTADDPYLGGDVQRTMLGEPRLRRHGLGAEFGWRLDGHWRLRGGYRGEDRLGRLASLARGYTGESYLFGPPSTLELDTWGRRLYLGGSFQGGRVTITWGADYQKDGGDRGLVIPFANLPFVQQERVADDRESLHLRFGSTWDAGSCLLFGGYGYVWQDSKPAVVRGRGGDAPVASLSSDGIEVDARIHTGQFGLVTSLGTGWRLRLLGRLQSLDQIGVSTVRSEAGTATVTESGIDKERTRQVYSLQLSRSRGGRSRYRLDYRFEHSDEDANTVSVTEYLDGNVQADVQASNRVRDRHDVSLRTRHRLSRRWTLVQRAGFRYDDIAQDNPTLVGQYAQGDRHWRRLGYRGALRWRPRGPWSVDAGYQLIRERFERDDIDGVRTDWDADRVFVDAAWWPRSWLTGYLAFSYGKERYDIDSDVALDRLDDEFYYSPVTYRTETYRLSPGLVLRPAAGWTVEGHYERVRNRDSVANDTDRWYGRVTRGFARGVSLTFAYRRWQFDENLGDDYIADLYSLSLSARF